MWPVWKQQATTIGSLGRFFYSHILDLAKFKTMKLSLFTAIFVLGQPLVAAYPFQEPEEGDVRSPCPALNVLANNGIIPRDGKGINGLVLADALYDYFGLQKEMSYIALARGAFFGLDTSNFDLDSLFGVALPYSMFLDENSFFDDDKLAELINPLRKAGKTDVTTIDMKAFAVKQLVTKRRCDGEFDYNLFEESLLGNFINFAFTFLFAGGQGSWYDTKVDANGMSYKSVPIHALEEFLKKGKFPSNFAPRDFAISDNVLGDVWGPFAAPFYAIPEIGALAATLKVEPFWQQEVADLFQMLMAEVSMAEADLVCPSDSDSDSDEDGMMGRRKKKGLGQ